MDAGPREVALPVAETDVREPGFRLVEVGLRVVEPDGRDPAACGRGPRLPLPGRGADRRVAGLEADAGTLFRAGAEAAVGRETVALPMPRPPAARERDGPPVAAFGPDAREPGGRGAAGSPLTCLAAGREAVTRERPAAGGEERGLDAGDLVGAGEGPRGAAPRDAGEEPLGDRRAAAFPATIRGCGPARLVAAGLEPGGVAGGVLRGAASPRGPFLLVPVVFVGIKPP